MFSLPVYASINDQTVSAGNIRFSDVFKKHLLGVSLKIQEAI